MKTIRMDFSNMWGPSNAFGVEYFLRCFPYLRSDYHFVLDRDDPEFVFYSVYGYIEKLAPRAIRLVWAGEAGDHFEQPGVNQAGFFHYGITMAWDNTHENHIYMPLCCLHLPLHNTGMSDLVRQPGATPVGKEYFCNFIYSNGNSRRRVEFFHKLSQYKRVESLGAGERNNDALVGTGYDTAGYRAKQAFQSRCWPAPCRSTRATRASPRSSIRKRSSTSTSSRLMKRRSSTSVRSTTTMRCTSRI